MTSPPSRSGRGLGDGTLVLRDVEVAGERVDVRIVDGTIEQIGEAVRTRTSDEVVAGAGGALLPGLWDHHMHLLSAAAAMSSVDVGPRAVRDLDGVATALRARARVGGSAGWVRGVGYHESVAGDLDRHVLDRLAIGAPVRIQHRSGALWILDSRGCDAVGLDSLPAPGVERDDSGRPTGRVFGLDSELQARLPDRTPDLAELGRALAGAGVVGVTDMTPCRDTGGWDVIAGAVHRGELPQHVVVTGAPVLAATAPPPPLRPGPVKVYLADHDLPHHAAVVDEVSTAHDTGRPVAFHSVTRASLVLALAALDDAGSRPGDRIEHGAVVPPALVDDLRRHGLTVVTQPSFVAERGDQYVVDVDPDDLPHLYPCASLLAAGVPVAGSTDAPFTNTDPWAAVRAAVERRAASGAVVGSDEVVDPETALRLFLSHADDPGGPGRTVAVGAPADLCLLDRPLVDQLRAPTADAVAATIIDGRVVHRR